MPVPAGLPVGTKVFILTERAPEGREGIVTEARPQNSGYLVRPLKGEGSNGPGFGWGYSELGLIPKPGQRWHHIDDENWICEITWVDDERQVVGMSVGPGRPLREGASLREFLKWWEPLPPTRWERLMETDLFTET